LQTIQTKLAHYQAEVATWQAERWADWQERIAALSEQMTLSQAPPPKKTKTAKPKVLMVLGDGGHSTEMFALIRLMGEAYQYAYMINENDLISEANLPFDGPVFKVPMILGKYKVYRNLGRVLWATWHHWQTLWRVRPEAIISSGASIAIPVSLFGRVLGIKVIFVETGSRVFTLSGTGKVMYYLANKFFVQWEPLAEKYPKAIYAGRLL
jgi:UDP-N-acetylglucosamine:LPS N-acetylglucosamine transferase